MTSQKLPFQCSVSVVGACSVVFHPSTVEHLPSQWSHPKCLQASCSRRLCSAVYCVDHYCCVSNHSKVWQDHSKSLYIMFSAFQSTVTEIKLKVFGKWVEGIICWVSDYIC